jgi:hypothetical protein
MHQSPRLAPRIVPSTESKLAQSLRRGFWVRILGMFVILGVLISLPFTVPLIVTWLMHH